MGGFRNSILEINTSALIHNLSCFLNKIDARDNLILVLKANAYGAGAIEVARLFENEPRVEYYAVASISEGAELREAGILKRIIVLSPSFDELNLLTKHQLEPVIFNPNLLSQIALESQNSKPTNIHLNLDTGMHRVGFSKNELGELIRVLKSNSSIKVATAFSHYSASGRESFDEFSNLQSNAFSEMVTELTSALSYPIKTHLNNSGGIERFGNDGQPLHRLGIGLYGISSIAENLKSVFTWKVTVSHIQWVKKGESVSYNRSWVAPEKRKIATVFVGYADGLNRRLSNGKWALKFENNNLPIVGNICMDLCMVDATNCDIQLGDILTILNSIEDVNTLAAKLETISYEVFTSFSRSTKRVYT